MLSSLKLRLQHYKQQAPRNDAKNPKWDVVSQYREVNTVTVKI